MSFMIAQDYMIRTHRKVTFGKIAPNIILSRAKGFRSCRDEWLFSCFEGLLLSSG